MRIQQFEDKYLAQYSYAVSAAASSLLSSELDGKTKVYDISQAIKEF